MNARQTALYVQHGGAKQQIATVVFASLHKTLQCRRIHSYLFVLFHVTVDISVRNLTKDSVLRAREKWKQMFQYYHLQSGKVSIQYRLKCGQMQWALYSRNIIKGPFGD